MEITCNQCKEVTEISSSVWDTINPITSPKLKVISRCGEEVLIKYCSKCLDSESVQKAKGDRV